MYTAAKKLEAPYELIKEISETGRRPVVVFAAGGIATPAIVAMIMPVGAEGVFVRSGIFYLLQGRGNAARGWSDPEIFEAKSVPPRPTRAQLRSDFIRSAQEAKRHSPLTPVHLKLNDHARRTVPIQDPSRPSIPGRMSDLGPLIHPPWPGLGRG